MKVLFAFFLLLFSSITLHSQTTAIPDVNFEQALINMGYDVGPPDGIVQTDSINSITQLWVNNQGISDLSGIEDFTALWQLECYGNDLIELDLSNNPALALLNCPYNKLTLLNISNLSSLFYLTCSHNQLSTLDISDNIALEEFYCDWNKLGFIDVSNLTALKSLNCARNELNSLDISQNDSLIYLQCGYNQIASLNVQNNTQLTSLECLHNELICLNVKNGNNANLSTFDFRANYDLTCVEVDSVEYASANWGAYNYSKECPDPCAVGIEEKEAFDFIVYPNPTSEEIHVDLGMYYDRLSATLVNAQGQTVLAKDYRSVNLLTMKVKGPSGIYFLRLQTSSGEAYVVQVFKR